MTAAKIPIILRYCPFINGLFAQYIRYMEKYQAGLYSLTRVAFSYATNALFNFFLWICSTNFTGIKFNFNTDFNLTIVVEIMVVISTSMVHDLKRAYMLHFSYLCIKNSCPVNTLSP